MNAINIIVSLAIFLSANLGKAWVVEDPANLAQNAAHFLKQAAEMERMAERIKHEITAAMRLAERLKDYKLTDIRSITSQINSFRSRVRSIGYAYGDVSTQFEKFYKKGGQFSQKYRDWQKQSDDSIKDAMVSQGLLEKSEKHMIDLEKVLDDKRKSAGNADTLQALGEINAIQSRQLADLSQIIATDARAKQSILMEERAKDKDRRDREARLLKDFNQHKKSRPLAYLPSLGKTAPKL